MMNKSILTHLKFGQLLPPELKDDGNFAGDTYFDCAGLDAVLVLLQAGTVFDADLGSTAEATPPYLEECDTTNGTYTKIASSDLAAVLVGDADNGKIAGWHVDRTKTRKRYLAINQPHSGNGTTGTVAAALAIGLPAIPPVTAAQMGLKELIQV